MIQFENTNKEVADFLIKSAIYPGLISLLSRFMGPARAGIGKITSKIAPALNTSLEAVGGSALTRAAQPVAGSVKGLISKTSPTINPIPDTASMLEKMKAEHATRLLKRQTMGPKSPFNKPASYNELHVILKKAMK
jgi:hypothetical protein